VIYKETPTGCLDKLGNRGTANMSKETHKRDLFKLKDTHRKHPYWRSRQTDKCQICPKKKRPMQIQKDEPKRPRLAIKTYKCTTNICQKRPTKVTYTNSKSLTKRIPASYLDQRLTEVRQTCRKRTKEETYTNSVRLTDDTCARNLCTLIHESTLSHDIHVKND